MKLIKITKNQAYQAEGERKGKRANCFGVSREPRSARRSVRNPSATSPFSNWRASVIISIGFALLVIFEYLILFGKEWWHFLAGWVIFFIAFIILASQIRVEDEVKTMNEKPKFAPVLLVFLVFSVLLLAFYLGIRPYNVYLEEGEPIHIEYSFFDILFLIILTILDILTIILLLKVEKEEDKNEKSSGSI